MINIFTDLVTKALQSISCAYLALPWILCTAASQTQSVKTQKAEVSLYTFFVPLLSSTDVLKKMLVKFTQLRKLEFGIDGLKLILNLQDERNFHK